MRVNQFTIDARLINQAEQREQIIITEGRTDGGLPVTIIVGVGFNASLLKHAVISRGAIIIEDENITLEEP